MGISGSLISGQLWSRVAKAATICAKVLLLSLLAQSGKAQTVAVTHCRGECPRYESIVTANQSNLVIHHVYAASVSGETALPDWVAYRLSKDAIGVASLLPRTWQPDRLIKFSPLEDIVQAGEAELRLSESITRNANPYGGTAAVLTKPENRTRLAPITSFANTAYWSDLNNFSNMVPMPLDLRMGPWLQLEQRLNNLVAVGNEAYVITGPIYLIAGLSLAPSTADINPGAYYKLVSDESGVVAFVFPQDANRYENFCAYRADLADVEDMTDLEFFPNRGSIATSTSLLGFLGCQ